jgi:predicted regulator of Ras-like GTPase activity (Roadblock/LC7/MglB family)/DNA-binding response OmpR family regulator
MSKKRVLVVDDEQDMLWMLQRNLNKGMPDVEVLTASSGEEALALLSDTPIELVITDINMPGMNGLDLLIEINNRYPETGVIIMTAYPSIAYEREAMMSGSLRFVEKPFDIKDMRAIVKTVLKESDGFQGTVSGIDLLDIIQFNGLSRATSALKVTTSDDEGMIFFREGEVVHAMCDQLTGEDAFFKIIGLTDGTIQNIRGVEAPIVSIKKSLDSLLLETAVRGDEEADDDEDYDDEDYDDDDQIAGLSDSESIVAEPDEDDLEIGLEPGEIANISEPYEPRAASQTEDDRGSEPALRAKFTDTPSVDDEDTDILEHNEEDPEMTEIQKILTEFTNIEGVHTACLVGRDGFILDNIARTGIDAEMIGAIASSGFGSAESMGGQLGQGNLNLTMIEYAEGPVMFAPVGSEAFLVIVADKDTNLGWIRLTIKKNSKVIEKAANL